MSIASRITSMENNIRNAYHGLDSIGIDTTNTNKNIENISALLEDFYDSLPKVSGTGSILSLNPTLKGRLGSTLKGNTLQDGTPTPSSPVEIQSATGLQNISVCGKNLFNKNTATGSSLNADGTTSNSNTLTTSDFIRIDSSKTYYKTASGSSRVKLYDKNKNVISTSSIADISNFSNEQSFTIPYSNAEYIRITMTNENVDTFMLHIGSTATTYEAYNGETYDINLGTIKLNKIGDYQDYITGTPNNWSIKRQIGNVTLNGQETWAKDGTKGFYTQKDDFKRLTNYTNAILSNNFIAGIDHNGLNDNEISGYSGSSYQGQNWIYIKYDSVSTANDFKTWLSTHNTQVDYVLATETTEPITNTELIEDLNNLYYAKSYNGTTNIFVEGDLPMILDVSALKGE